VRAIPGWVTSWEVWFGELKADNIVPLGVGRYNGHPRPDKGVAKPPPSSSSTFFFFFFFLFSFIHFFNFLLFLNKIIKKEENIETSSF
jgi:hypothetical protein